MDEHEMLRMLRDWLDAWNSRDEERVRRFYTEDAILYQAPARSFLTGREHIVDRYRVFTTMSDDSAIAARDMYIAGDTAILEATITGTHTGVFMGHEPTHRTLTVETCLIFKVQDGKIVKHTTYLDTATILRALGLLEIPGTRAEAA